MKILITNIIILLMITMPFSTADVFGDSNSDEVLPEDIVVNIDHYEPTVVRTEAVESGSYPVLALLTGIQSNPTITIPQIRDVNAYAIEGGDKYVSSVNYKAPYGNQYTLNNLGYLVIWLKQVKKEDDVPKRIDAKIRAEIEFDISKGFGIFEQGKRLKEQTQEEFLLTKNKNSFWGGRGYIKVNKITDNEANLEIYDSQLKKIKTLNLREGETSGEMSLNQDFFTTEDERSYFKERFKLKLNKIAVPENTATLEFFMDGELKSLTFGEGDSLYPGSEWKVGSIDIFGDLKKTHKIVLTNGKEYRTLIKTEEISAGIPCTNFDDENLCNLYPEDCKWDATNKKCNYKTPDPQTTTSSTPQTQSNKDWEATKKAFDAVLALHKNQNSKPDGTRDYETVINNYLELMKNDKTPTNYIAIIAPYLFNSEKIDGIESVHDYYMRMSDYYDTQKYNPDGSTNTEKEKESKAYREKANNLVRKYNTVLADLNLNQIPSASGAQIIVKSEQAEEYYLEAIKSYQKIITNYPSEKHEKEDVLLALKAQRQIAEIYDYHLNDKAKAIRAYKEFLTNFPNNNYIESNRKGIEDRIDLLESRQFFNFEIQEFADYDKQIEIIWMDVEEADRKDLDIAYISINGATPKKFTLGDEVWDGWRISKIEIDKVTIKKDFGSPNPHTEYEPLSLDKPENKGGANLLLTNIETKREALLTVLPSAEKVISISDFNIHIPIEPRTWKLSPEQLDTHIDKTAALIKKLDSAINTMDNIYNLFLGYCGSMYAVLMIKNFAQTTTRRIARFDVMSSWKQTCNELMNKEEGRKYRTLDQCIEDNADLITDQIGIADDHRKSAERLVDSGQWKNDPLFKEIPDTVDEEKLKDMVYYQKLLNEERWDSETAKKMGENFNSELLTMVINSKTKEPSEREVELIHNKFFNSQGQWIQPTGKITEESLGLKGKYTEKLAIINDDRNVVEKIEALENILENEKRIRSRNYNEQIILPDNREEQLQYLSQFIPNINAINNTLNSMYASYTNPTVPTGQGVINVNKDYIVFDTNKNQWYDNELNKPIYKSDLAPDQTGAPNYELYDGITPPYETTSYFYVEEVGIYTRINFATVSSQQVQKHNPMFNLFTSGSNKGRVQMISIDAYSYINVLNRDISGKATQFNVYKRERPNTQMGSASDRLLTQVEPYPRCEDVIDDLETQGKIADDRDVCDELEKLEKNVEKRNLEIGDEVGDYLLGAATQELQTECYDFMDPNDCLWLFGACDPVMCPPSRFTLGGRYNYDNVVQTGIAGSIILGLPNWHLPQVWAPVCVTGISAGLRNIRSIAQGYLECLEKQKDSGEAYGSCAYVRDLGVCRIFWREFSSILSMEGILGQVLKKVDKSGGGGEYISFYSSLKHTIEFTKYFTNNYATTVFAAYRGGSTEEIGTELCERAIYGQLPGEGSFMDQITTPEGPPQFFAMFDESPHANIDQGVSDYHVLYHVYAGTDRDIRFRVYLKNEAGQFREATKHPILVEKDDFVQDDEFFYAASGFKEVCVEIIGQSPQCGFGSISTSFATHWLNDYLTEQEMKKRDIDSESECLSETGLIDLSVKGVELGGVVDAGIGAATLRTGILSSGTTLSVLNPGITQTGIIRKCSPYKPGPNWEDVGNCGTDDLGRELGTCWLDIVGSAEALKSQSLKKDITTQLLDELQKQELTDIEIKNYEAVADKEITEARKERDKALDLVKEDRIDDAVEHLEEVIFHYLEAIKWYNKIIEGTALATKKAANTLFKIAEIYFNIAKMLSFKEAILEEPPGIDYSMVINCAKTTSIDGTKCACGTYCQDYINWILENAQEKEIDPLLILSLMIQESACKKDAEAKVSKPSLGLMQINIQHCGKYGLPADETECRTVLLNDPEKNIQIGTTILKEMYDSYKNGRVFQGCTNRNIEYKGWEAALRGYNGWSCGKFPDGSLITSQDFFVENVLRKYERLKEIAEKGCGEEIVQASECEETSEGVWSCIVTKTGERIELSGTDIALVVENAKQDKAYFDVYELSDEKDCDRYNPLTKSLILNVNEKKECEGFPQLEIKLYESYDDYSVKAISPSSEEEYACEIEYEEDNFNAVPWPISSFTSYDSEWYNLWFKFIDGEWKAKCPECTGELSKSRIYLDTETMQQHTWTDIRSEILADLNKVKNNFQEGIKVLVKYANDESDDYLILHCTYKSKELDTTTSVKQVLGECGLMGCESLNVDIDTIEEPTTDQEDSHTQDTDQTSNIWVRFAAYYSNKEPTAEPIYTICNDKTQHVYYCINTNTETCSEHYAEELSDATSQITYQQCRQEISDRAIQELPNCDEFYKYYKGYYSATMTTPSEYNYRRQKCSQHKDPLGNLCFTDYNTLRDTCTKCPTTRDCSIYEKESQCEIFDPCVFDCKWENNECIVAEDSSSTKSTSTSEAGATEILTLAAGSITESITEIQFDTSPIDSADKWFNAREVIHDSNALADSAESVKCMEDIASDETQIITDDLEDLSDSLSQIDNLPTQEKQELTNIKNKIDYSSTASCSYPRPSTNLAYEETYPVILSLLDDIVENIVKRDRDAVIKAEAVQDFRLSISCDSNIAYSLKQDLEKSISDTMKVITLLGPSDVVGDTTFTYIKGEVLSTLNQQTPCSINTLSPITSSSILADIASDLETIPTHKQLSSSEINKVVSELNNYLLDNELKINNEEFLIYANKHPDEQWAALVYYKGGYFTVVGADTVSTANPDKYHGANTPLGVHYVNRIADAGDWGSPYGRRGQEVYDFSIGKGSAFHPTNEPQLLGQRASHGCVRMTDQFNDFLDRHNILHVGSPIVVGDFFLTTDQNSNQFTVVIDPGHGGEGDDNAFYGATGPSGVYEKDLMLIIAKRLELKLQSQGINVILTRNGDDRTLSLFDRINKANSENANLFISLHANSRRLSWLFPPEGTESYIYCECFSGASTNGKSDKCETSACHNTGPYFSDSLAIAESIQSEITSGIYTIDLGVQAADFTVLEEAEMPAILVETAYISNADEEATLKSNSGQEIISQAIANVIMGIV